MPPSHNGWAQDSGRWVGVGSSSEQKSRNAGFGAADAAMRGPAPKLLLVFASEELDLPALLVGINERTSDAPLIGCSTAGEIATDGPGDAGVVVVALGGDGMSVETGVARNASASLRDAGATAAGCLEDLEEREYRALLLLTDGLAGDQQEIVRGAYSVAGAGVPLVGGCAGDDLKMQGTAQFYGDEVLQNAVVGAAVASSGPLGIGCRHGWRRVGDPMLVTASSENRVFKLDGKPALDVYLERLDAPPDTHADPAAFTAFALTHPLGLNRRSGEEQVRLVGEADFRDRSLGSIAEVPQGALAWFMEGDKESVLAATDAACDDALEALEGRPPLGLLAFDCIARRGVLGDEGIAQEVRRVAEHADGAPVAGFYTYGEIARTHGVSGFHNQTLVVLALG